MKYLKATWTGSNPGGGVSIQNLKEQRQTIIELPNGARQIRREKETTGITVMPARADMNREDLPVVLGEYEFWFKKGEFAVQDIPENRDILEEYVKKGRIMMNDWDLQEEFSGIKLPEKETEVIVDSSPEVIDITPVNTKAAKDKKKKELVDKLRSGNKKE